MLINKRMLDALLFSSETKINNKRTKNSASGPGYRRDYRALLDVHKAPWVQSFNQKGQKTPQIIFSYALIFNRVPTDVDYFLIKALIQHYEVKFYRGDETSVTSQKILTSMTDFWQQCNDCRSGTVASVQQTLARQGLDKRDYLILDREHYIDLYHQIIYYEQKSSTGYYGFFGNESVPESKELNINAYGVSDLNEYVLAIDLKKIEIVTAIAPNQQQIKFILSLPNLKTINLSNVTLDWLYESLSSFANHDAEIVIKTINHDSLFTLTLPVIVKKLTFRECNTLTEFELLKPRPNSNDLETIEALTFLECEKLKRVIGDCPVITKDCDKYALQPGRDNRFVLKDNQLEIFSAESYQFFKNADPNLKIHELAFVLGDIKGKSIIDSLDMFPNLEILKIELLKGYWPGVRLNNLNRVRKLTISVGDNRRIHIVSLPGSELLEELHLNRVNDFPYHEIAEKFPNLKHLTIKNASPNDNTSVNLPPLLLHLKIDSCERLIISNNDLTHCQLLQTVQFNHTMVSSWQNLNMHGLPNLERFFVYVDEFKKIVISNLEFLANCPKLRQVHLYNFASIESIKLEQFPALESLVLSNISNAKITADHPLPYLQNIFIAHQSNNNNSSIEFLVTAEQVPNLKILNTSFKMPAEQTVAFKKLDSLEQWIDSNFQSDDQSCMPVLFTNFAAEQFLSRNKSLEYLKLILKDDEIFSAKINTSHHSNLKIFRLRSDRESITIYCDFTNNVQLRHLDIDTRRNQIFLDKINSCKNLININITCHYFFVREQIFRTNAISVNLNVYGIFHRDSSKNPQATIKIGPNTQQLICLIRTKFTLDLSEADSLSYLEVFDGLVDFIGDVSRVNVVKSFRQQNLSDDEDEDEEDDEASSNNDKSILSLTDLYKTMYPDANTSSNNVNVEYAGEIKVNVISGQHKINSDAHLCVAFPQVEFSNQEFTFPADLSFEPFDIPINAIDVVGIEELRKKVSVPNSTMALTFIEATINSDSLPVPLVTHQYLYKHGIVYCDRPNDITTYRAQKSGILGFKLKPNLSENPIRVLYLYEKNSSYENALTNCDDILTHSPLSLLEDAAICLLTQHLFKPEYSHVHYLFDFNLPVLDKIQRLFEQCFNFEDEELDTKLGDSTLAFEVMLALIAEMKGACRHRFFVFMVLAHFIGVPVIGWGNQQHIFVDLFVQINTPTGSYFEKRRLDYSGRATNDTTPAELYSDLFNENRLLALQQTCLDNSIQPTLSPEAICYQKLYTDQFNKLMVQELSSIDTLLKPTPLAPLILLKDGQSPLLINQEIIRQLRTRNIALTNYLYIHNENDLLRSLYLPCITDEVPTKKKGRLQHLIIAGGILVINWSGLNDSQIMTLRSIIDSGDLEPTLMVPDENGIETAVIVTKKLRVIGLSTRSNAAGTALSSRCISYHLLPEFFQTPVTNSEITKDTKLTVDLFGCIYWEEILLAKIIRNGHKVIVQESEFIKNRKTIQHLDIYNPPTDDEDFELFKSQITHEQQIPFNGDFLPISCSLSLKERENPLIHENVKVIIETPTDLEFFYVGQHNLHECLHLTEDKEDGSAIQQPSYFELYNENKHIFYVIRSINKNEWQFIISKINDYQGKNFTFMLAPGVEIEGVLYNDNKPEVHIIKSAAELPEAKHIIQTNDLNFACQQLSQMLQNEGIEPLVYHFTPDLNFASLFYTDDMQKLSNGQVLFSTKIGPALKSLLKGHHVICINPDELTLVYLAPLLQGQHYLYFNGKRHDIRGTLSCVTPIDTRNTLSVSQLSYTFENYRQFLQDYPDTLINKVKLFYEYAAKWPHNKNEIPQTPYLSFNRLQNLLNVLKTNQSIHPHNPLKSIFVQDYAADSAAYAYLSVIAKFLFCPNDGKKFQRDKYLTLIEQHHIDLTNLNTVRPHIWELLNCCRGELLVTLFGNYFLESIKFDAKLPMLADELTTKFVAAISNLDIDLSELFETKESKETKRWNHLVSLISQPDKRLIIIKGPSGSGKFHTFEQLKQHNIILYNADETGLLNWLQANNVTMWECLVIRNANKYKPETWNFLNGLMRGSIQYKSETSYPIAANKKILITLDDEIDVDYFQTFFQDHGEIIRSFMPNDDFFEHQILMKFLPEHLGKQEYCMAMIFAFRTAERLNQTFVYSIRHISNLGYRFIANVEYSSGQSSSSLSSIATILYDACLGQFLLTIYDEDKAKAFTTMLQEYFANHFGLTFHESQSTIVNNHFYPASKAPLIRALKQNIIVSHYMADKTPQFFNSRLTIIEGEPGNVKSTLSRDILIDTAHPKKFSEVTVGSRTKDIERIVEEVCSKNIDCVMDEINLEAPPNEESRELIISRYLDQNTKPGGMIIATQNSGAEKGRKPLSKFFLNRAHVQHMHNFTRADLIEMSQYYNLPHTEIFVDVFLSFTAKGTANIRTFYTCIKILVEFFSEDNKEPTTKRVKH